MYLLISRNELRDLAITGKVLLDVREGWAGDIFRMWVCAHLFFIVRFIQLTP